MNAMKGKDRLVWNIPQDHHTGNDRSGVVKYGLVSTAYVRQSVRIDQKNGPPKLYRNYFWRPQVFGQNRPGREKKNVCENDHCKDQSLIGSLSCLERVACCVGVKLRLQLRRSIRKRTDDPQGKGQTFMGDSNFSQTHTRLGSDLEWGV